MVNIRYSLRQVECFRALAKTLHFGRAAQQVHMTQPAFSRQIMSIEEATGLKLVNRNSHSVSLTTAGKTFLEGCEKALIFLEDAHNKAKLVDRGIEGSIKVGHTDLAISSDLPKLIGAFNDQYPKIILDFFMGGTQQILTKLYKKELDIGFVTGPLEKIDLNYKPVGLNLLPEKFTMPELQKLYEIILDKKLNRGNFYRKMTRYGILEKLNETRKGGAHKAPDLYKFDLEKYNSALENGLQESW